MAFTLPNRREAMALLGGAASIAVPFTARAEMPATSADVAADSALDRLCAEAIKADSVPAVAAGWQSPTQSEYTVRGTRDASRSQPVAIDDQWHIGSISKSMTALLLARLVSARQMRWQWTLGDVFPELAADFHPGIATASLEALVTGRSGLISVPSLAEATAFPRDEADPRANRVAYTRLVGSRPPVPLPAEGYVYPNSAFIVAAAMAERATGKAWEDLIRQEVFGPLGLNSAAFGPPPHICGHRQFGDRLLPICAGFPGADNPAIWRPAGGVHLSIADFVAYASAHTIGAKDPRGESFLSKRQWSRLHTPPAGSPYAYGIIRLRSGLLFHNGSNTSWYAEMLIDPATRCSAVAVGSSGNCEPAVRRLVRSALDLARAAR